MVQKPDAFDGQVEGILQVLTFGIIGMSMRTNFIRAPETAVAFRQKRFIAGNGWAVNWPAVYFAIETFARLASIVPLFS